MEEGKDEDKVLAELTDEDGLEEVVLEPVAMEEVPTYM